MAAPSPSPLRPLRILLPPNLAAAAARDAIAVKIEGDTSAVPEIVRAACVGPGPWLLQLRRVEMRALLLWLAGQPVFAWANRPAETIAWEGDALVGATDHLREPVEDARSALASTTAGSEIPNPKLQTPNAERRASGRPIAAGSRTPIAPPVSASGLTRVGEALLVDGSEHFLAISILDREHPAHAPLLAAMKTAGFVLEPSNRKWWLRDRHGTLTFLAAYWDRLEHEWGARFTENFRRNTSSLHRASVLAAARETPTTLEVDLALDAGGAPADAVQRPLAQGRDYVEHAGRVYLIAPEVREKLHAAQRILAGDPATPLLHRSRHAVPRHRAADIEEVVVAACPNFRPPDAWRAQTEALRQLAKLAPAPLPPELGQQLRGYQRLGAAWLYHLARNELGGILADEMGLGKTAQALALLVALQNPGQSATPNAERPPATTEPAPRRLPAASAIRAPSTALVVCPASLVENWRREAVRFAPGLRVLTHHGENRLADAAALARYDLIVTSYGTLVRDQELFAAAAFTCLVADEAQHVKNRRTQAAQALRSIAARARFGLTGTPVENSLDDLRALFDLVLPGALAPIPAAARGDERTWHEQRVQRQTAPYILRRTKAQVAPELPPKIEQTVWCEPTGTQRTFYEEVRAATEREIDALTVSGQPEAQVRLAVFTQLLRLRQVCCDPRLVSTGGDDAVARFGPADSAKLAAFRELLDEALDDGHRLLVFSQFTSLLALLRDELAAAEVPYCYLDGAMTARARQAAIDSFQDDQAIPVFLISLKAGGTGLNLTGADTVIHFDPWWNPAVEAQATDRAHRIDQTRVVTSYKLVVPGTVEEKVLQLQETKRRLLADVFAASDALSAKLELADLRALAR